MRCTQQERALSRQPANRNAAIASAPLSSVHAASRDSRLISRLHRRRDRDLGVVLRQRILQGAPLLHVERQRRLDVVIVPQVLLQLARQHHPRLLAGAADDAHALHLAGREADRDRELRRHALEGQ